MAVWRIINRTHLKYASGRFIRNYSQASLASSVNSAAKQTRICSSDNSNSNICRLPYSIFETVRSLATSAQAREKIVETDGPRLNDKITASFVRLVVDEEHTILPRSEALRRARELKLDLVEVQRDAEPPVCKLMDYNFEKYKRATVSKEKAKAKRSETTLRADVKEVHFSPKIEVKDLKLKADQVMKMMDRGYRVKCMAIHDKKKEDEPGKLLELLSRFAPLVEDAVVVGGPCLEKKQAFVVVRHAKYGPPKKGKAQKLKDIDVTTVKFPSSEDDSGKNEGPEMEDEETDTSNDQAFDSVDTSSKKHKRYATKGPDNDRDSDRFGPRSPNQPINPPPSQPHFANRAPNQHPTPREPRLPNQPVNPQPPQPRFPNQAPNQHPTAREPRFTNQPANPQPPQPRLPNQAPNQPPTRRSNSPASGYGIFSTPGPSQKDR